VVGANFCAIVWMVVEIQDVTLWFFNTRCDPLVFQQDVTLWFLCFGFLMVHFFPMLAMDSSA